MESSELCDLLMKLGFLIKIEREGEIFIREIGGEMGVLGGMDYVSQPGSERTRAISN